MKLFLSHTAQNLLKTPLLPNFPGSDTEFLTKHYNPPASWNSQHLGKMFRIFVSITWFSWGSSFALT